MLRLPDDWLWDFWFADDGTDCHVFFLCAPRSLPHPDDRHHNASIGHAVSSDLRSWTRLPNALIHGDDAAFDRTATWTGSVMRDEDGTWSLFYTGADVRPEGNRQTIGYATSSDLMHWTKNPGNPVCVADGRWYEVLGNSTRNDEAFRDPWVVRDPAGDGWHLLITARGSTGPADDRGVIGHAWSPDLRHWETRPPLTEPGQGFGHLEVCQVEQVDGRWVLVFACLDTDLSENARSALDGRTTGVWAAAADGPLGPFDLAGAWPLTDSALYSGRLVRDRSRGGRWSLVAFRNLDRDCSQPDPSGFPGDLTDPMPVGWIDGRLAVLRGPAA